MIKVGNSTEYKIIGGGKSPQEQLQVLVKDTVFLISQNLQMGFNMKDVMDIIGFRKHIKLLKKMIKYLSIRNLMLLLYLNKKELEYVKTKHTF